VAVYGADARFVVVDVARLEGGAGSYHGDRVFGAAASVKNADVNGG
jgi:hypothetical protein